MKAKNIGKIISELRKKSNLTQEVLAEKIGVNSKTISKWETGTNVPDTYYLLSLGEVFGVNIQDILNGNIKNIEQPKRKQNFIKRFFSKTKIFKNKIVNIIMCIIIGMLLLFTILYTLTNYNTVHFYGIYGSDHGFTAEGYLIFTKKQSGFVIERIDYSMQDNISDMKINRYFISIKSSNDEVTYISLENDLNDNVPLERAFEGQVINFSINSFDNVFLERECLDHIYLIISYDIDGERVKNKIKLNFDKFYSNNKIFY